MDECWLVYFTSQFIECSLIPVGFAFCSLGIAEQTVRSSLNFHFFFLISVFSVSYDNHNLLNTI